MMREGQHRVNRERQKPAEKGVGGTIERPTPITTLYAAYSGTAWHPGTLQVNSKNKFLVFSR